MKSPNQVLPVIVLSQFCCTSLWFAGNGVMTALISEFTLPITALGHLTSSIQLGFITGTLTFALLTIADRFSPSRVFFFCALAGAGINLIIIFPGNTLYSLLLLRFVTGFFLAGIYPIGMKIAADYYDKGLGKSLGFLVGALVLGTAFPHLLSSFGTSFQWDVVLGTTSGLACTGGLMMFLLVPDGPYRKSGSRPDLSACFKVFRSRSFRTAAYGYFGHMWELYAFWAFVPVMLAFYNSRHPEIELNVPMLSFIIIGSGGIACAIGGYLSERAGTHRVAFTALTLSGCCCLLSPLFLLLDYTFLFLTVLLFWGMVVVADSPLFSTLVAQNANAEIKGTALTIVNCVGFAITIFSIQLLNLLQTISDPAYLYLPLAAGPAFGLLRYYRSWHRQSLNGKVAENL